MNYSAWKGEDVSARADLSAYSDQPSTWAAETMQWAVAEGLISGVTADSCSHRATQQERRLLQFCSGFSVND